MRVFWACWAFQGPWNCTCLQSSLWSLDSFYMLSVLYILESKPGEKLGLFVLFSVLNPTVWQSLHFNFNHERWIDPTKATKAKPDTSGASTCAISSSFSWQSVCAPLLATTVLQQVIVEHSRLSARSFEGCKHAERKQERGPNYKWN